MKQLPLIDAEAGTPPASPALDAATIRALRSCNVLYLRTQWSAYWQEWQHHIQVRTTASCHEVVKNDAGIAAMLGVRTHAAKREDTHG